MKRITHYLLLSTLIFLGCNKEKNETIDIEYGTGIDNNGHTFTTVKIGDQWWMAENLGSNRFQNDP